ncbi:hypothetical protein [Vogesella sp. XCS3]|uniref:hypothetical protein n=1 Tax=Vogesella sp. XCS3 TaxID=2877939 RepID=UPI001D0BC519|nr:hypothetical protein [Vogesella sp. XCS3]UDM18897.1 hypothetical protein LCH97_18680 [Vogesella sp. XCS3]
MKLMDMISLVTSTALILAGVFSYFIPAVSAFVNIYTFGPKVSIAVGIAGFALYGLTEILDG